MQFRGWWYAVARNLLLQELGTTCGELRTGFVQIAGELDECFNSPGCAQCHFEHQGATARLTTMDHVKLAEIGLKQLEQSASDSEQKQAADQLVTWIRQATLPASLPNQPALTALEMTLNCSSCHSTKDRHRGLFGGDCAACHGTTQWNIAGFRHPSPRSFDCAQCHQTTSWNDIKGVGHYKHH